MPSEVINYKCPACTGPLHFWRNLREAGMRLLRQLYTLEEIEALQSANAEGCGKGGLPKRSRSGRIRTKAGTCLQAGSEWGEDAEKLRSWLPPSAARNCSASRARRPPPSLLRQSYGDPGPAGRCPKNRTISSPCQKQGGCRGGGSGTIATGRSCPRPLPMKTT